MREVRLILLLVGSVLAAFMVAGSAAAQQPQVIFGPDPELLSMEVGEQHSFTASIPGYTGSVMGFYRVTIDGTNYETEFGMSGSANGASVTVTFNQSLLNACISGNGYLRIQQQVVAWLPAASTYQTVHVPCSVAVSPTIASPTYNEVCGPNNDTFNFPAQEASVNPVPQSSGWSNGQNTLTYVPNPGYAFHPGVSASFTFYDTVPCETEAPLPPTQTEVCGTDNDPVAVPPQPTGVLASDSGWNGGTRTITFSAAAGFVLPAGVTTEYVFLDAGPCLVTPVPPVQKEVCGIDNDTFTLAVQPVGVVADLVDSGWSNGTRSFTYSAEEGYVFVDGVSGIFTYTDSGPCITEPPLPPTVTEVCGPENDVVLLSESQPANVIVASDGQWLDGAWMIAFSASDGYALPADVDIVLQLIDASTPCPTDAPVSPVQTAICGPDNDLITIPDQPTGVTLDTDTGWVDGGRTITFAVAPEFITDGPFSFTFTEINEPCNSEEVGTDVVVTLETSDGRSIAGTEYTLYAPVASQVVGAPFEQGEIGTGNQVVFEGLSAGNYRFVTSPAGYEPVDQVITVRGDLAEQRFTVQVMATQVTTPPVPSPTPTQTPQVPAPGSPVSTPTPGEPGSIPSPGQPGSSPMPGSTAETAVEPSPTAVVVTSLPQTGSGPNESYLVAGFGIIAAVLGMAAVIGRRLRNG